MLDPLEKNYVRVFVAFPVSSLHAEDLKIIQQQNSSLDGIRWTPPQNLHLTIFFLGNVLEENISSVSEAVSGVINKVIPFRIEFEKIRLAGKNTRGSMIWSQFHKNDSYSALSINIYQAVKTFLLTQPVFKDPIPHITLARLKRVADTDKINLSFENKFELPEIDYCELWKTLQTKEGVVYKSLARFDFRK